MTYSWRTGNQLRLLENGDEYFPKVFQAISEAKSEIIIETFILFEDAVGKELHSNLIDAARRDVKVLLTVDGYGTHNLSVEYISSLTEAGVRFQIFDPRPKLMGLRTNLFRRLHRKLVVIDGQRAFLGGINLSEDHLKSFGPCSKQDYAVEIVGPVVEDIHHFAMSAFVNYGHPRPWYRRRKKVSRQVRFGQEAEVLFVVRDNDENRTEIEKHYLAAMRNARHRIVIANAYFFPGYRLLKVIFNAAKRGVTVKLILQGESDMRLAKVASRLLYDHLLKAGVHLYECCERPMHGKVAVIDDEWATIGSSNLDPMSLSFNLEANIVVRDRDFNLQLNNKLQQLISHGCKKIDNRLSPPRTLWRVLVSFFVFHFLRHFPSWAVKLPSREQKISVHEARKDGLEGSQH